MSLKFVSEFVDDLFMRSMLKMDIAAHRTALNIQLAFEKANKNLETSTARMTDSVGARFLTLGGAAKGVFELAKAGDEVATGLARIGAVTGDTKGAVEVMEQLRGVTRQTGGDLGETIGQFSRFTIAAKQIGASNGEVVKLIELIQKAGIVSGSSSEELGAAATQLGQALASGRFQGDELRSIMENLPILAESLARNLGVSIGQLRQMGKEGELTTENVFPALLKASEEIDEKFKQMPVTMNRAFGQTVSTLKEGLAVLDSWLHVSKAITVGLGSMTKGTEEIFNELLVGTGENGAQNLQRFMRAGAADPNAAKANVIPGLNAPLGKGGDSRTKEEIDAAKQLDTELKQMNEDAAKDAERRDTEARKRAEQLMKVNQQGLEQIRSFYVESLEGEAKLKALEEDRRQLAEYLAQAEDDELANIQAQINAKDQQIALEKRLQSEKFKNNRFNQIAGALEGQRSKLAGLQDDQLAFELMGPDARRQKIRDDREVKRAQERLKRVDDSRRNRGGSDARPGSNAIAKEIELTENSINGLAKALANLIPTQ